MTDVTSTNVGLPGRDGRCKILVSVDAMEARLLIEPPIGQGCWPGKNEILEALRAQNITYGLDLNAINEVMANHPALAALIAKGKTPVPGSDGEINFLAGKPQEAHEDSTGRIDYHQIQTVQSVTSGQVIAEKIPATCGESGFNVHGKEFPAAPGKDKPVRLGKNVAWAENNLQIIATNSGEPSMVNNLISVLPVHEVQGDVNLHTGNITFPGNLIIHGNVESGFKVEAEGDVTIQGIVDAADVKAGGKLVIQGGISGMDKSKISCEGDLIAKYIEHATVYCGGNIAVHEFIMHSHVTTDHKITVEGGKGLIVGGVVHAGREIAANTIGSRAGSITEIEVGGKTQAHGEHSVEEVPPELTEDVLAKAKEKGRVKVRNVIYPGVRVTMSSTTLAIEDEINYSTLVYHDGAIQVKPYQ